MIFSSSSLIFISSSLSSLFILKILFLPFIHLVFPREMHYKQQPELTQRNFADNNNYLLWGLLIKTDIYKETQEFTCCR